nr:helix-turn-helix transcriptional regulator [uncultured Sellimonas sp.]
MKINQIILEKRKELSLTQKQVADFLGVSTSAVNKWEKGSTYPDITLLPALARLLKTDLNTLLSFQDDLSDVEITNFVDEVDRTVQEKGYETAFQMVIDKIHDFPTCENLIYSAVMYLSGALILYNISEPERYEKVFESFYEQLSHSQNTEIKETAISMLISYSLNRKDFSKTEELINTLPSSSIDKEERIAILYTRQGKFLDAMKMWEHRILNSITEIQTALMNMLDIAVKEERIEDADFYADIYEQVSKLFYVTQWIPYNAKLSLAVIKKDKKECLAALKSILLAMHEKWKPEESPLYKHLDASETNILSERILDMFREEMENGNEFAFMDSSQEYQQLLQELKNCNDIK